jgi:hypothetical protein
VLRPTWGGVRKRRGRNGRVDGGSARLKFKGRRRLGGPPWSQTGDTAAGPAPVVAIIIVLTRPKKKLELALILDKFLHAAPARIIGVSDLDVLAGAGEAVEAVTSVLVLRVAVVVQDAKSI